MLSLSAKKGTTVLRHNLCDDDLCNKTENYRIGG